MQPTAISITQPVKEYCYDATRIKARGKDENCRVVYRGFEAGIHFISDGKHEFRATRVSKHDEEPVFEFSDTDKV